MKVDMTQKINELYSQNAALSQQVQQQNSGGEQDSKVEQSKNNQPADRVDISSGSRLMQRVNAAEDINSPERAAKVQQIKSQVENGTYQVASSEQLASAMMKDIIGEIG